MSTFNSVLEAKWVKLRSEINMMDASDPRAQDLVNEMNVLYNQLMGNL